MSSNSQTRLSAYFPDRQPTWTEVVIGVLIGIDIGPNVLPPASLSWPAAVTGFLAFSVALGPGANSSFGQQIGQWWRGIGVTRGIGAIVLFAVTAGVVTRFDAVPNALIVDAATGGLLATLLYLIAYIVRARGVSGWKDNSKSAE
ncbi:MAG: hypothetical protein J07HN4v3_03120 [Halonotius sp. J07HN4]|nr:MAG: hypothetical protein J07HN4v3_03120 [Halonotius sp. J07HN4]